MKLTLKNVDLVMQSKGELYTGIFNVSTLRINNILKDGCGGTNPLISNYNGGSLHCKSYTMEMANATKLNFVDVFEVADALYNGEYYIAPYCIAWDLGTAQHQTLGFWMKSDHVLSISTVRLGYGSAPNFADASNISCNYNLTTAQTLSASGEIAGTTATMIVKITPYTINQESWLFFEIHIDGDQAFNRSLDIMVAKADGGSGKVGNKIITANWTHVNSNVQLNSMTYYPAQGHNPKKDPSVE